MDYHEFMAVFGGESGFQTEGFLEHFMLGLQVDIYRNLRAVDCRRVDGIPDASEEEREQSLIQNVRFKNFISYEDYLNDLHGITAQIRRRPKIEYPELEPRPEVPEGVLCDDGVRTENPPRDHDVLVLRAEEIEGAWSIGKELSKRVARTNLPDESARRKTWQNFVDDIKFRSLEDSVSKFRFDYPEGTTQEVPVPIRGTDGFALSLQAQ